MIGLFENPITEGAAMADGTRTLEPLIFTVQEVAELLGLSRTLAYAAIESGEIPSVRIGRRIVVPRAAINRMLAAQMKPAASAA